MQMSSPDTNTFYMDMARSNRSIYFALAANVAIAIAKFVAGSITGSGAMVSEGVHSLVDSINELLLLYGIYRSNKQRDKQHPFGYGRDLYFWSFIVAILIFGLGAGVSFYQGVTHLKSPGLTGHLGWNYAVLAFSLIFDGGSFLVAFRDFNKTRGGDSLWAAIVKSKNPASFMVLFEDGAAILGLLAVTVCLLIEGWTRNPYMDGIASIIIGVILTIASALLARESRSLLMGEGISTQTEQRIISIVKEDPSVRAVKRIFSMYESPDEVLLVIIISFDPLMTAAKLTEGMAGIKKRIEEQYPKINYIIIQPE
jgi:cation diffusion facilitator family transporter